MLQRVSASGSSRPSQVNYDLNDWKWGVLYKRRLFLVPLHNGILFLVWLYIAVMYTTFYRTDRAAVVIFSLSALVSVIHVVILLLMLTKIGANHMQYDAGLQGRRICYWLVVSTLVAMGCLIGLKSASEHFDMDLEIFVVFTLLSSISISIFQHIGLHHACSFAVFIFTFISFIYAIANIKQEFTQEFVILPILLLGEYILYAMSAMQHVDSKFKFSQSQEHHKSRSDRMNQPLLLPDLLITLNHIDDAISSIVPVSAVYLSTTDNQWRWTKDTAILQVQRLLVLGFRYSLEKEDASFESDTQNITRFCFFKTCKDLFAMLEASLGHSLPLFVDEDLPEISINGNQEIFEIMIFLLIYETVYLNKTGFCKISCETDPESSGSWIFSVSVTSDHSLDLLEDANTKKDFEDGFNLIPTGLHANEEAVVGKTTTWTRFAHILALRYLNVSKWQPQSEYNGNFKTLKQNFKIKENLVALDQAYFSSPEHDQSSATKTLKHSFMFVNDIESFSNIQQCLEVLHVPFESCAGHELKDIAKMTSHSVAVIHESQLKSFDELNVDLPNLALSVIVLFDMNNIINLSESSLSTMMKVKRIRVGENIKNMFDRIKDLLDSLDPRPLLSVDGVKKRSANRASDSNHPGTSASKGVGDNLPSVSTNRRWLLLLDKFDKEVKNGCIHKQNYIDHILSSMQACKTRFESEEINMTKSDIVKMISKIESEYPHFPAELESKQKIAKLLVEKFLTNNEFEKFMLFLKNKDYNEMKELCTIYIRRANDFHQRQLSCWFTSLHDVCGIMHSHFSSNSSHAVSVKALKSSSSSLSSSASASSSSTKEYPNTNTSMSDDPWKEARTGLTFDEKINQIISDMINLIESSIWRIISEG